MTDYKRRTEDITPEMAAQYLTHNHPNNRRIAAGRVRLYALQMRTGQWHNIGDPIRFDSNGFLIDGQQRLSAVIESDTTQQFDVIRGLPPEAFILIDIGRTRNPGDVLGMAGYAQTTKAAAVARLLIVLDAGMSILDQQTLTLVTREDILDYVNLHHEKMYEAMARSSTTWKHVGGIEASWSVFNYYAAQISEKHLVAFLNAVESGADLSTGDPRLSLRNLLLKDRYQGSRSNVIQRAVLIATYMNTWNNWLAEKRVTTTKLWRVEFPWPVMDKPKGELTEQATTSTSNPTDGGK